MYSLSQNRSEWQTKGMEGRGKSARVTTEHAAVWGSLEGVGGGGISSDNSSRPVRLGDCLDLSYLVFSVVQFP